MKYVWIVKTSDGWNVMGRAFTIGQAHCQAMAKSRELHRLALSSWEQVRIIEVEEE